MQKQKTKDLEDILKKAGALEKDRILKEIRDVSFFRDSGMKMRDLWDKKVKDEFCERFIYIKEFG